MPRFFFVTLLLPVLWHAGTNTSAAEPVLLTTGSMTATRMEFRFAVPGAGPLVFDLFSHPGVYHTPLHPETTLIGGTSDNRGALPFGSFAQNGVPYTPPVAFEWSTTIALTRILGPEVAGVPFYVRGAFMHPGFGSVGFAGGGLLSIDADRTVFAFAPNAPEIAVIPEPGTLFLLASGLVAVHRCARRRRA